MNKIRMNTPLVEMDGDEMTRVIWQSIKDELINPFVDLKTEYYDLGMQHRDATDDKVTVEAAHAIQKHGVGVKCATITANADRVKEYSLKKMWKSPNGTIRGILDGTVFRTPIVAKGIESYIPTWTKPITVARHAYGDVYSNTETYVSAPATAELVVTYADGQTDRKVIKNFDAAGILQANFNTDASITSFAHVCFKYAISVKQDLWFAAKDTISKIYDHRFKDIFQELYDNEYKADFEKLGIEYFYTLIDDAVARMVRAEGGMVLAFKNYDGDVMSDLISATFGSLAMMTSVLVSPSGCFEYEAAHGTVQRHYYQHLKGKTTSTNSMATIFAWSGALKKRGELDDNAELVEFAERLEQASLSAVEDGYMTKDLYAISTLTNKTELNTIDFILEIKKRLQAMYN